VPVAGAVGPKSDGSSYNDTAKRGCTFSANTSERGFKLSLKYSFTRNGDAGYVQPDRDKDRKSDEKIDSNDIKKISFVGNSGIKLGSCLGNSNGVTEVAIFDTQAMVGRVSVTDGGVTFTGIEAFIHRPPAAPDANFISGVPIVETSDVKFSTEFISANNGERLSQLLNGIGLNQILPKPITY
jgi:hypothetical protein